MSDYNLTIGIDLSGRKIKSTIPNETTVSELKYIAKVNSDNYIAENVIDGISKGFFHYLRNGEDIEEIFYSSDETNISEIIMPDNFGTITEIDESAELYPYLTRTSHEKVYAIDEDSNKQETMTRDEIMKIVEDIIKDIGKKVSKSGDTMNGSLTATDFIGKINGMIWDIDTVNNKDTWLLVMNEGKLQHRYVPLISIGTSVPSNLADGQIYLQYFN